MSRPNNLPSSESAELHLWRQAIAATRGALIITDNARTDNPIIYANQAFLDLTGYDSAEILDHNCRFLQGEDTDPASVTILREAVQNGNEARVTLRNYKKDGTMFWNDLLMSPIRNEGGEVTHFIGMQLDVTERIEHEAVLEASRERLKRSNQELEQFTYAASHDLQEPLRMVHSFMQLIDQRYSDKLDTDGRSFVQFAMEGANRMQTLVSDLLRLSRIRTQAQPTQAIALSEAVQTTLSNLQTSIEETGAAITIPPKLPMVQADASQIGQLLQNLFSNAIKYAKTGQAPHITLEAVKKDDWVTVTIKDDGIGIEPQYRDRIFIVFQRLHTREDYPGTGVGLAICQKIVERQGGRIWVTSTPGKGSSFHFTIPAAKESA